MPKSGHITPSQFKAVMTKGRTKNQMWGQTALTYADRLAMNRATGIDIEEVTAKSLEHGKELEPFAIQAYERENFAEVYTVETPIHHPDYEYICGTMDGLVMEDGMIEVKCPINPLNHFQNIMYAKQYEKDYKWQIQGYLWITGRKWCDFVSFHTHEGWGDKQLFSHRITRDEDLINQLEERMPLFWQIVEQLTKDYLAR